MGESDYQPRYSGAHCSGVCECGHQWDRHHLGIVANKTYFEATKESHVPQECEFYGFNETGGLDAKGNPHCFGYRDRGVKGKVAEKARRARRS